MKTVYIVRHAKSSWEFINLEDHERPLLKQGIMRTNLIGDYLIKKKVSVDLMISSHAVRAYETARIIAEVLAYPAENILIDEKLYHADADDLLYTLTEVPDDTDSVMLVGHNPTVTEFVNAYLRKPVEWMPTSAVACFTFKTKSWEKLPGAGHKTKFFITPKMLKT